MHWNLIPSKLESRDKVVDFDSQYSTFNARIETVATAPTFQESWRSQRCLVVVDGIIEWVGEKRRKILISFSYQTGFKFAMAGLWSRWHDRAGGEELWSCTVIVEMRLTGTGSFCIAMAVSYSRRNQPTSGSTRSGSRDSSSCSTNRHTTGMARLEFFPISRKQKSEQRSMLRLGRCVLEPAAYPEPSRDPELLLDL